MTHRERFLITAACGTPDRGVELAECCWGETARRWMRENGGNMPEFTFDFSLGENKVPVNYNYHPPWKQEILKEDERYYFKRDVYGILRKFPKDGREDIAQYVSFPLNGPADWPILRKRLEPRKLETWDGILPSLRTGDKPVSMGGSHLCGFYSFIRELAGDEEAGYLFYDEPELVREILSFQADRICAFIDMATADVTLDRLFIFEDMCYKNGPLIGPNLFEKFLLPVYSRVITHAKEKGVKVIDVDSDGNVTVLLPLWIEAGVNMMHPFEVQAGMDVNRVKQTWGDKLALHGGIDKRELARDRAAVDREIERIRPAFEMGGYMPCNDHSIPPDVPLENYLYYLDRRRELIGKP